MNNHQLKPAGVAIRELRENLIKVMKDSGLDAAIILLVMKDLLQQLAIEEAMQIQQYRKQEKGEEGDEPERGRSTLRTPLSDRRAGKVEGRNQGGGQGGLGRGEGGAAGL